MYSNNLVGQFTDQNPRFVAYRDTPEGRQEVGTTNYQFQAWQMAEDHATDGKAVILDRLGNLGHGSLRTRLHLSPAQLAERIKK